MRIRLKYFSIALVALTFPASVWATNGYFTHGVSTAEKGLAGAGVAFSQDTLAAGNNPAGMVWQGARYDIGAAVFGPMREYKATGSPSAPAGVPCGPCPFSIGDGNQSIDSENEAFLIPQFGYNWVINDDSTVGVSVFGNGGMNTEYKGGTAILGPNPITGLNFESPGTFGDGTAGVDLSQLFIATTYAAKVSDKTSWGVSGIIAYQRFEAKGLANFSPFSNDPGNLTNNSHDTATGIGVRLGIQTEISPGVRFGAAFQPEIDMSEFDDYAGLFAEDGDFNIPSTFTVGLAIDVRDHGVLVVDLQQINYEDVDAVSNPIAPLTDGSCAPGTGPGGSGVGDGCLGGDDGAGFGWEDMTILKVGYQWQDGDMTWRVGFSTGDQPIPSSEVVFNILAPGVMEEHFTFGFTKQIDAKSSFNFAAMYAPSVSVDGTNTFDPSQEIELEMEQYELAFTYNRSL
jgi:long-chain fatty acid transport protein